MTNGSLLPGVGACTERGSDKVSRISRTGGALQSPCTNAPTGAANYLVGRLTLVTSSASSTAYNQYSVLGNILQSTQTTGGAAYPFYYTYNLANAMTGTTLPSGRLVAWGYDNANRPITAAGTPPGAPTLSYAASVLYASQGDISQFTLGNGLVEVRTYDPYRQQPVGVTLGVNANDSSRLALGFSYCVNSSPCINNNGNLLNQTIGPLGATETYTYDNLNRLYTSGEKTGATTNWSENFQYDSFGNRWVPSSSGIVLSGLTPTTDYYNSATNRLLLTNGYFNYDSNGNQTLVSPYAITYDAENRQTNIAINGSTTATYAYDGDGRRVTKTFGPTTTYVYDAQGDLAAEYSTQPQVMPCLTCYLSVDHLGSTRLLTDQNGNPVSRHDFLPFGEELATSNRTSALGYGITDNVMHKNTSKERDTETGFDFFRARYFSGALGRFTGPDSKQYTGRTIRFPQKWDKYGYAQNNPLNAIDPDGLDDYKIFIAAPEGGGGDWRSAQLAAEANGHTLQVFQGAQATLENWNKALEDPAARAVFVGHSTHDETGTTGLRLINGVSAGSTSQTDDESLSATVAGVTVNANTLALFGCDTQAIMYQYGPDNPFALASAFIVGMDSGANKVSSLEAMGMAAAAFVAADAAASPDPVAAANMAFQQNHRQEDLDGDKVVQQTP